MVNFQSFHRKVKGMQLTKILLVRRPQFGFTKNMPQSYLDRMKMTVPERVYDNRFGAPMITRWKLHPDDYEYGAKRPWEWTTVEKTIKKAKLYNQAKLNSKFYNISPLGSTKYIDDDTRTFLEGDKVQIMIGKDKNKQERICQIVKERNWAFVQGMHKKLIRDMQANESLGMSQYQWEMQPLDYGKGEVMLVDPSDLEPCEAEWILDKDAQEYIRISSRTKTVIPIPRIAHSTYEYNDPKSYVECSSKDTPADVVLENTYEPTLSTFEDDISEQMGIADDRKRKPTYWY